MTFVAVVDSLLLTLRTACLILAIVYGVKYFKLQQENDLIIGLLFLIIAATTVRP